MTRDPVAEAMARMAARLGVAVPPPPPARPAPGASPGDALARMAARLGEAPPKTPRARVARPAELAAPSGAGLARMAVADCETDPFMAGRNVYPFVWGFWDGDEYRHFWGDDCTEQFLTFLRDYKQPLQLFAHNGGKFDWLFLIDHIHGSPKLIGPRVIRASLYHHTLRDSYANMPVALASIKPKSGEKKGEIDYQLMHRWERSKPRNKRLILDYLHSDCTTLYDAVKDWHDMFGNKSETMASAAMVQLKQFMEPEGVAVEKLSEKQDAEFRPYYYGGRVECLRTGIINAPLKIYDVNSMYPYVMAEYSHPTSNRFRYTKELNDKTDFAEIEATSQGCLPVRSRTGGIEFPRMRGVFLATGHEIRAGLRLGLLEVYSVRRAIECVDRANFRAFVEHFQVLRQAARIDGDEMRVLFYKLVSNSAYGKFALNPDKFKDMLILPKGERPDGECLSDVELRTLPEGPEKEDRKRRAWFPHVETQGAVFWARGSITWGRFLNVATAASITGAARAMLMEGLSNATNPVYCDTDSIICEALNARLHKSDLGAWKYEGDGHTAAIAGKKLYAVWNENICGPLFPGDTWDDLQCIKSASKGVRMAPGAIRGVAEGEEYLYTSEAPVIGLNGQQSKLTRRVRATTPLPKKGQ